MGKVQAGKHYPSRSMLCPPALLLPLLGWLHLEFSTGADGSLAETTGKRSQHAKAKQREELQKFSSW